VDRSITDPLSFENECGRTMNLLNAAKPYGKGGFEGKRFITSVQMRVYGSLGEEKLVYRNYCL
jgi:dTDP-D-glucose 4,6-dehydratase